MANNDKNKQSNLTNSIFIVTTIIVLVALIAVGIYASRLQKELNGARASYKQEANLVQSNNAMNRLGLSTCLNDVNQWLQSNSGVSGVLNQQILVEEQQAKINTCKTEYGSSQ